jgi:photosystem II stability/assembly factor-like uncharacterized protein
MRKIVFILLIVLFSFAGAQQWTKLTPTPTPRNLNGVGFANSNVGCIVGDGQAVYVTRDGGTTWSTANLAAATSVQGTFWFDELHAWVVGSNNSDDCFRTVDGGLTWTEMTGIPLGSWYAVRFKSPTFGWATGNGGAAITRDGGITWQSTPYNAVMFWDTQIGLAWNDTGVYKTTDGGLNWSKKLAVTQQVTPQWLSSTVCVASGDGGVYRSINAGETWTQVSSITGYYSMAVLSPKNVIYWNYTGNTIHSNDGGVTWTEVTGQCPQGIMWAVRVNDTTCCAVSGTGDVYRTTDAGASWTVAQPGQGVGFLTWDICFVNESTGFIAGQGGIVMRTDDGGATWRNLNNGNGDELNSIRFGHNGLMLTSSRMYINRSIDGGNFWQTNRVKNLGLVFGHDEDIRDMDFDPISGFGVAAGFGGTIFRTLDFGVTWQSVGYPAISEGVYFYSVKVVDSQTAYAGAQDFDFSHTKSLYKTTDGGQTWTMILPTGLRFIDIDFVDPQHGMMLNLGKNVYRTSDGGQTWQTGTLPLDVTSNIALDMVSQNVAYECGWDGFIAKTTNGGATWSLLPTGTSTAKFMDIQAVSEAEVWALAQDNNANYLWHSVNGGQSWTQELIPNPGASTFSLSQLAISPTGQLYAGGYDGYLMRRGAPASVVATGFTIAKGLLVSGGLAELQNSEDQRLVVRQQLGNNRGEAHVNIEFAGISPTQTASALSFAYEGQISSPGIGQTIDLFDYAAGAWVQMDTRIGTVGVDSVVTVNGTNVNRFIEAGTRRVKARMVAKQVARALSAWQTGTDRVVWTITP